MASSIGISVDTSFIDLTLDYFQEPTESGLSRILEHTAASRTHAHALRFGNTSDSLLDFWDKILKRELEKGSEHASKVKQAQIFMEQNNKKLMQSLTEVTNYLPTDSSFDTTLYANIGYDSGIVSDGDALINLGYKLYHSSPCEIIYMSMHEIHHVGFTHFNPLFSLADIRTTEDLFRITRFATHLEGMAVYAPLGLRIKNDCLHHEDYQILMNQKVLNDRWTEYWRTYQFLSNQTFRPCGGGDLSILERMSGSNQRLWYVAGAHMARMIDENLGRDVLVETIRQGPTSFFEIFEAIPERKVRNLAQ